MTQRDDVAERTTAERAVAWMRTHWVFLVILGAGFVLRTAWLLYAQPTPVSDWHAYRQLAADLIDHRQFGYPERTDFYLPIHPFHLAAWSLVSRSAVWLGFSSVVLSTSTIGLIYALGLRMYRRRTPAAVAAALFAVLPVFVLFSPVLATEHIFIVLMLSAMLCLVSAAPRSTVIVLASGMFAGLAMLTRGEAVFYVPALILFVWMGSSAGSTRDKVRATALLVVGVVLVITPWYLRNAALSSPDTGLSSGAGINFYFAHNDSGLYGWYPEGSPLEGLSTEEANRLGWRLGLTHIRDHPMGLLGDIGFGTSELLRTPEYALFWSTRGIEPGGDPLDPDVFTETRIQSRWLFEFTLAVPVLLVLGAAALLTPRSWPRRVVWLIVPLIASSWLLRSVLFWAKPRYGYFITVMLVFVAAISITALLDSNRTLAAISETPPTPGTDAEQKDI